MTVNVVTETNINRPFAILDDAVTSLPNLIHEPIDDLATNSTPDGPGTIPSNSPYSTDGLGINCSTERLEELRTNLQNRKAELARRMVESTKNIERFKLLKGFYRGKKN